MVGAESPGDDARVFQLVIIGLGEADRESLQRLGRERRDCLVPIQDRLGPPSLRRREFVHALQDEPMRAAEDLLLDCQEIESLADHDPVHVEENPADPSRGTRPDHALHAVSSPERGHPYIRNRRHDACRPINP